MVWNKPNGPKPSQGPIYDVEFIVVGRRGRAEWTTTRAFRLSNAWPRAEHSAKPEEFYDLLRRIAPAPRLDVFNRRRISGFRGWGHESPPDRDPAPDHYQEPMDLAEVR